MGVDEMTLEKFPVAWMPVDLHELVDAPRSVIARGVMDPWKR